MGNTEHPVWADVRGTRVEITWPPGFMVRFTPSAEVLAPDGTVIMREGEDLNTLAAHGYFVSCPQNGEVMVIALGTGPPGQTLARREIEAATEFRQQFGFASDLNTILRVASDPDSSLEFGVPLTRAEVAEINRRHEIATLLGPLKEALEADPRYGGLYIEQSEGGRIHIGITRSDAALTTQIESLMPPGATYSLDPVAYSYQELSAKRDEIEAQFSDLSNEFGLDRLTIDPRSNRVDLGINPYTKDAAAGLVARFGPQIEVEATTPVTPTPAASQCGNFTAPYLLPRQVFEGPQSAIR